MFSLIWWLHRFGVVPTTTKYVIIGEFTDVSPLVLFSDASPRVVFTDARPSFVFSQPEAE